MSGRIRLHWALLSALTLTACSEDIDTPAAPEPEKVTRASAENQQSPILELLPAQRTGSADLINTPTYDPSRPGSLLSLHQKSIRSGLTSELRVVHRSTGDELVWLINGRRFASLDYGQIAQNRTSLEAATRAAGPLTFYNVDGEPVAVFDPTTRKFTRIRAIDDHSVEINPFGDDRECEDAIFGFFSNVVGLALFMEAGNPIGSWGGLTGLYFTWRKVETDCYWVYRIAMWEFANSTLGSWW